VLATAGSFRRRLRSGPDARYAWKGDWGHVASAGLLRELTHETARSTTRVGGLAEPLGQVQLRKDDIRWMASKRQPPGRYVGLNFATTGFSTRTAT